MLTWKKIFKFEQSIYLLCTSALQSAEYSRADTKAPAPRASPLSVWKYLGNDFSNTSKERLWIIFLLVQYFCSAIHLDLLMATSRAPCFRSWKASFNFWYWKWSGASPITTESCCALLLDSISPQSFTASSCRSRRGFNCSLTTEMQDHYDNLKTLSTCQGVWLRSET